MKREQLANVTTEALCQELAELGRYNAMLAHINRTGCAAVNFGLAANHVVHLANRIISLRSQQVTP